jgi:magnesium transporter
MIIKKGAVSWTHMTNPSDAELAALEKEHHIHPTILDELLQPSVRSKVEIYDHYMFIVYHLPIFDIDDRASRKGEIDMLVTAQGVITVTYENLEPIHAITEKIDTDPHYKDRVLGKNSVRLLYDIMEACLAYSLRQLRHVEEKIDYVRARMFKEEEQNLVRVISYVKRDLLSYHLITRAQASIFTSLNKVGQQFFGESSAIYFSNLEGDFLKVLQLCENYKETAEAFESTNAQLLNIKMTKVMQRFSVLAFLTFPIMVFLALFTIDTISRPIVGKTPYDFWILTGVVIGATAIMTAVFSRKGWL